MNKTILTLLEAKFQGVRKDGLTQLANSLALTCANEDEAKTLVEKLTSEAVADYVKEWRRQADAENTAAAQTRENNLREKYDLTEKGKKDPKPEPKPDEPTDIAKIVREAVAEATKNLQDRMAAMQAAEVTKTRRAQVEALFGKDTPETYKKTVLQGFEGRQFADDAAFNQYVEETKTTHAAFMQDLADRSLRTDKPIMGGVNKDGVSEATANYIKAKTESGNSGNNLGGIDPFKN